MIDTDKSCNADEIVACLRSKDDEKKWESSSFDELVRVLQKGIYPSDCFRPFPPMLGNGHCVDLWKLYSVVNQKGGFESVSEKGLWEEVCELSQLSPGFGPALKLVYLKYLELVECLLSKLRKEKAGSGLVSEEEELMELETDFSRFVSRMEFVDLTKENGEKRKLRRKSGCVKSVIDVDLEVVDLSGQNFDDGKLKRKNSDMNFGNDGVLGEVDIIDGLIKTKRKKSEVAYVIDEYLCPESDGDGKLEKTTIGLSLSDDTIPGLLDDRGSSDGAEVGDNLVSSLESLATSKKGSPPTKKKVDNVDAGVLTEDFVSRKIGLDSRSVSNHEIGRSENYESPTSFAETDSPVVSEAKGSSYDGEVGKNLVKKFSAKAETKVMNGNTLELQKDISCPDMKQDSLLGMLRWMADVSKNPTDPAIGEIPENSKWPQYGSDHCWKQVLLARQALFLKKERVPQNDQRNPKMHPSMFDDQKEAVDRPRYHAGLLSPQNPSNTYTLPDNSNRGRFRQRLLTRLDLQPKSSIYTCRPQQRIPTGEDYQAELPEWTGLPSDGDTKWLGTQVWPLERRENKSVVEREPIGKGRGDTCGCQFRDSPSCVKFHVYEKAKKMELELGSAFYAWDFHTMGEGCNISWTALEERKFKNVVKENPAKENKNFWHQIGQVLPQKTWAELVTYYFNVFKLRRRGSQNRLKRLLPRCEMNVDSDDDETEYAISY